MEVVLRERNSYRMTQNKKTKKPLAKVDRTMQGRAPLCFVLMPFGRKPNPTGKGVIDFDSVYQNIIVPAVKGAGLEAIRADEEMTGGIIHKPMFERLVVCDYAVADLTMANPNVFYELGLRHALLRATTVLLCGGDSRLPFDVAPLRTIRYALGANGVPKNIPKTREMLKVWLEAQQKTQGLDSPVFELLQPEYPDLVKVRAKNLRQQMLDAADLEQKIRQALREKESGRVLLGLEKSLGAISQADPASVTTLFFAYRSCEAWKEMVALGKKMNPKEAARAVIQEQMAFALNRDAGAALGGGDEKKAETLSAQAERILLDVLERSGASSETFGLLGRIYKDRWHAALKETGSTAKIEAQLYLDKAIEQYTRGFETDWRDYYPGVNAVTLMTIRNPPDPRTEELRPVVAYSVERRIAAKEGGYWLYATRLELAVLAKDQALAEKSFLEAKQAVTENWQGLSTAGNVAAILEAFKRHGGAPLWAINLEGRLRDLRPIRIH